MITYEKLGNYGLRRSFTCAQQDMMGLEMAVFETFEALEPLLEDPKGKLQEISEMFAAKIALDKAKKYRDVPYRALYGKDPVTGEPFLRPTSSDTPSQKAHDTALAIADSWSQESYTVDQKMEFMAKKVR